MADMVYTVTDVNRYVEQMLGRDRVLRSLRIRGEVSNLRVYPNGHTYFSLKDDRCLLRCVWLKGEQRSPISLQDGMRVIARGSVGLYSPDGQFQLFVRDVEADGSGRWYERFEALKQRLGAEGLFDAGRKRPLPRRPRVVGLVTSSQGAALRDMVRVSRRRWGGIGLLLCPVPVQGVGAAERIAEAIGLLGSSGRVDVIIVGRGGGSVEDLWAFNEEIVARAIAACPVPVISAVGHETDFTIADFVADVRAATPSMAAELAVPDARQDRRALHTLRRRMDRAVTRRLHIMKGEVRRLRSLLQLAGPEQQIRTRMQRLDGLSARLMDRMDSVLAAAVQTNRQYGQMLSSLHPERVLARGYAIVSDQNGRVVERAGALRPGQEIVLRMQGGRARAGITAVEEEK